VTSLSIVVPCFNEGGNVARFAETLLPVVRDLQKTWDVELVLVDDGSKDDTLARLEDLAASTHDVAIKVLPHGVNRGLGAAVRTGFAGSKGDVVVTTDSDGTYAFTEIPRLLSLLGPDVDIVTASPYHPDGGIDNVPQYRLVLSKGASFLYRVLVDPKVHTYTALFRAYRRRVIDDVKFESDDFLSCAEILVNAIMRGYRVVEAPAVLRSRVIGQSKARIARIIRSHLKFQARIIRRRAVEAMIGGRSP
jgi:dolichol-phosphate mannosyltransferase